jgi:hypothetical protein
MNLLASPATLAVLALLLGAASHPAHALAQGPYGRIAVSALALLAVLAAAVQAVKTRRAPSALVAAGMLAVLLGTAYDHLRGHSGRLVLRAGDSASAFEEEGPGGASLGLRPLGAQITLDALTPARATFSVKSADHLPSLAPGRAASLGGLRLSWVEHQRPVRLRLGLARGERSLEVDLDAGAPVSVEGIEIALERYFPDFALDANQQPYTRSDEPRNPAALLNVQQGGRAWRAFVIRALPGIHDLPELEWKLSLLGVESDDALVVGVHREPFAAAAGLGLLLAAAGLVLGMRR